MHGDDIPLTGYFIVNMTFLKLCKIRHKPLKSLSGSEKKCDR